MKVLFISNDPTIFDPSSATRERMRAYAAAIGELHIISRSAETRDEQDGDLVLHGVRPWPTILGRALFLRTLGNRAHTLILEEGIEVVSAQDPFEHGAAAQHAVHGTHAKLHVQVHTDFLSPHFAQESRKNKIRVRIADSVLPKADGIRVVSKRIKTSIIDRYGDQVCEPVVIPVVVDAQIPEPASLSEHPFSFAFIAVGRLEAEKRIEDIITALARIAAKHPEAGLFVVGEGRERGKLEQLVHEKGLGQKVVFLGNRPDARALMASANAFVQASTYEGYGRTLIEAALAGVPIVTTDVGIVGDVLIDGESVLVAPVGEPAVLAAQMEKLIEDEPTRRLLAEHAQRTAQAHLAMVGDVPALIAEDLRRLTTQS